jgi:hypothetical protein
MRDRPSSDRSRYRLTEVLIVALGFAFALIDLALLAGQRAGVSATVSQTAAHLDRISRGAAGVAVVAALGVLAGHLFFPRQPADPLSRGEGLRMAALAAVFLAGAALGNRLLYQLPPN